MDPISSFATIVGLICNFKSERRASSDDDYEKFVDWLSNGPHKSIVEELQYNQQLCLSIKNLLNQNNEAVMKKLTALDNSIVDIASKIDGFKEIAASISENQGISDQGMSILKQLTESGGTGFLEDKVMAGTDYLILGRVNGGPTIEVNESSFIQDDLLKLCELGLLRLDFNPSGHRLFHITRAAAALVEQAE